MMQCLLASQYLSKDVFSSTFPSGGDDVQFTVAEIRKGEAAAYPDKAMNQTDLNNLSEAFVSVQSVVVDPADRLWILDTGSRYSSRPSMAVRN
jgi:hypothetical protein